MFSEGIVTYCLASEAVLRQGNRHIFILKTPKTEPALTILGKAHATNAENVDFSVEIGHLWPAMECFGEATVVFTGILSSRFPVSVEKDFSLLGYPFLPACSTDQSHITARMNSKVCTDTISRNVFCDHFIVAMGQIP